MRVVAVFRDRSFRRLDDDFLLVGCFFFAVDLAMLRPFWSADRAAGGTPLQVAKARAEFPSPGRADYGSAGT
jgi:hypothetical protein